MRRWALYCIFTRPWESTRFATIISLHEVTIDANRIAYTCNYSTTLFQCWINIVWVPSRNKVYLIWFERLPRHCTVITCIVLTERSGLYMLRNSPSQWETPILLTTYTDVQTVNCQRRLNKENFYLINVLHTRNKLLLSSLLWSCTSKTSHRWVAKQEKSSKDLHVIPQ